MKTITVLGATGSIGRSTLSVVALHPEQFRIYALTAHTQIETLIDLCIEHRAEVAVVPDAAAAQRAQRHARQRGCSLDIAVGDSGLRQVASHPSVDVVMAAIVGAAGLSPVLAAAAAGKRILLANKEALVMSGPLLLKAAAQGGATLLPVDSEHNAIFQCLPQSSSGHVHTEDVRRLLLTASGGPFRQRSLASLENVTPEEACAHPNWVMGRKISVDSATMMNKGLEVIEAHWLFGLPPEKIEVLIHPQSVVHSLVEYIDGSVLAQLGQPDMRIPIAHALGWPQRVASGLGDFDLMKMSNLSFEAPDHQRFPSLGLAYEALARGGFASLWLNAANEVAVQAFLDRKISYLSIPRILRQALEACPSAQPDNIESVLDADHQARHLTQRLL